MDHVEQRHYLADPSADDGQRRTDRGLGSPPFELQERECDGRQDDVMRPAPIASPFEAIEPQVVFEFPVLLFDGPPSPRQRDERLEGGGRGDLVRGRARPIVIVEPDVDAKLLVVVTPYEVSE